ncbi:MAG: alkaline phosphatase family protein [Candidatus Helarchaeota archaeon]
MGSKVERVIQLILDDVRADQFFQLLDDGKLPKIRKYLGDGIRGNCTSIYPAITVPARLTLLTGAYPDAYSVPGMHWYERRTNKIHNHASLHSWDIPEMLGDRVKTLYEQVSGNTADLFTLMHRGVDYNFPTKAQTVGIYIWHFYILRTSVVKANEFTVNKILDMFTKPRKYFGNSDPPRFISAWFFSSDDLMHDHGYDSREYISNLIDIDRQIGVLIEGNNKHDGLKQQGYLDDTVFILSSDHGNYKAKRQVILEPYFQQHGLIPIKSGKKNRGNFDVAMGAVGQFYFKGKDPNSRPTQAELEKYGPNELNLLKILRGIDGMKLLYYRDDENTPKKGMVHVEYLEDDTIIEGTIEYEGEKTRLTLPGKDFFGYSDDNMGAKMLDGKFHTLDEWIQHTHHLDFPAVADYVVRLFKNPNSCDVLCSTLGETIFNYEHGKTQNSHVYGHDIATHTGMTTPLLISGSNITTRTLDHAKSSDLVPTIVKLLNGNLAPSVVGRSLV